MNVTIRNVQKSRSISFYCIKSSFGTATNISISKDTREKILATCEELKFYPNIHARRFFKKKSETIGLIIPPQAKIIAVAHTFTDYNIAAMLSGIEETVTQKGYRLTIMVADEDFINNKKYLKLIRDKSLDGVLLWGVDIDDKYVLDIKQEDFPYILLNSYITKYPVNYVITDNLNGSAMLTEYLIKTGYRK